MDWPMVSAKYLAEPSLDHGILASYSIPYIRLPPPDPVCPHFVSWPGTKFLAEVSLQRMWKHCAGHQEAARDQDKSSGSQSLTLS